MKIYEHSHDTVLKQHNPDLEYLAKPYLWCCSVCVSLDTPPQIKLYKYIFIEFLGIRDYCTLKIILYILVHISYTRYILVQQINRLYRLFTSHIVTAESM